MEQIAHHRSKLVKEGLVRVFKNIKKTKQKNKQKTNILSHKNITSKACSIAKLFAADHVLLTCCKHTRRRVPLTAGCEEEPS